MYTEGGVYHLLGEINHKNFAYAFTFFKEAKIHPGQMPLLITLFKEEGLSQRELASRLGIKPPTMNVMIGRLEKNGCIVKKQDPEDQRRSLIYFTKNGRDICQNAMERAHAVAEEVMKDFTEEEQTEFIRLLHKLSDCLDHQIEKLQLGKDGDNA